MKHQKWYSSTNIYINAQILDSLTSFQSNTTTGWHPSLIKFPVNVKINICMKSDLICVFKNDVCSIFRHLKCLKSKQECLIFRKLTKMSTILTKSLDSRHILTKKCFWKLNVLFRFQTMSEIWTAEKWNSYWVS